MSDVTLQRSPAAAVPVGESPADGGGGRRRLGGALPVAIGAVALLVISTGLVLWARTRPGFDPYGWLVWGHQTVHGTLDTNAAPSWKPLPFLFTAPYALLGHYELWLWMITSVAVSLSGSVFAARIAHRLVAESAGPRWAPIAAGAFAAVALLGIDGYSHYVLSSQSDPMIVALCLGAIDCHLCRRYRWAWVLGALASLGRPEVWPFLGLYAIWLWRSIPSIRWWLYGGVLALVVLWFGIPALTSRSAFVAGSNALGSGRALHSNKVTGTVDRFLGLHEWPLEVLALVSLVLAVIRRDRVTLVLAGGVVAWVIVEIAFALHGWPGLPRYMFEAAGVMVVIAAVGFGRLLAEPRRISRLAGIAGVVLAAAFAVGLVPAAVSRERAEHKDLLLQRARTDELNRLAGVVRRLGGAARLHGCGEPLTRLEYQTALAYQLQDNVVKVGFKYGQAIAHGNPIVLFTPVSNGWKVQAIHQTAAACRSLPR
jgi:hypothetical protein